MAARLAVKGPLTPSAEEEEEEEEEAASARLRPGSARLADH